MSEKQQIHHEKKVHSVEHAAGERLAELAQTPERSAENHQENLEQARTEAHTEALFTKEYSTEKQSDNKDADDSRVASTQERERTYKQTLKHVQSQLSAPERLFSKVIHAKAVERISDAVGGTVARPNAILFGGIFAFLGVLSVYFYARYAGFALSGFEPIAAFVIGWVVGVLIDVIGAAFGKRR